MYLDAFAVHTKIRGGECCLRFVVCGGWMWRGVRFLFVFPAHFLFRSRFFCVFLCPSTCVHSGGVSHLLLTLLRCISPRVPPCQTAGVVSNFCSTARTFQPAHGSPAFFHNLRFHFFFSTSSTYSNEGEQQLQLLADNTLYVYGRHCFRELLFRSKPPHDGVMPTRGKAAVDYYIFSPRDDT